MQEDLILKWKTDREICFRDGMRRRGREKKEEMSRGEVEKNM